MKSVQFRSSSLNDSSNPSYFKQQQLPTPLKGVNFNGSVTQLNKEPNYENGKKRIASFIDASDLNQRAPLVWVRVLCCTTLLIYLGGCGQRSGLTLPSEEEAKRRASLPQILIPQNVKPQNNSNSSSNPSSNAPINGPLKPAEN